MYCAKCGVELQKGVQQCPLCGLNARHPDIREEKEPDLYPLYTGPEEQPSSRGLAFALTILMLIPILVSVIVDLQTNAEIRWSGYAAGGILLFYVFVLFPLWFRRRNPVVLFPVDAAVALGMLLYVCLKTGGHWFMRFAFPVWGIVFLITETILVLLRYVSHRSPHRILIILGSGVIAIGVLCVFIELFLRIAFEITMTGWSVIPLAVQCILGILMIIVGLNRRLRHSIYKRIFI